MSIDKKDKACIEAVEYYISKRDVQGRIRQQKNATEKTHPSQKNLLNGPEIADKNSEIEWFVWTILLVICFYRNGILWPEW